MKKALFFLLLAVAVVSADTPAAASTSLIDSLNGAMTWVWIGLFFLSLTVLMFLGIVGKRASPSTVRSKGIGFVMEGLNWTGKVDSVTRDPLTGERFLNLLNYDTPILVPDGSMDTEVPDWLLANDPDRGHFHAPVDMRGNVDPIAMERMKYIQQQEHTTPYSAQRMVGLRDNINELNSRIAGLESDVSRHATSSKDRLQNLISDIESAKKAMPPNPLELLMGMRGGKMGGGMF